MTIADSILFIFTTVIIGACFVGLSYIFYRFIYTPHKKDSFVAPFNELMFVLTSMIRTELELFDKDIFRNKKIMTNSSMETAYYEISNRVVSKLSPYFWKQLQNYFTEEQIISMIARTVKNELTKRIGFKATVDPPTDDLPL